MGRKSKNGGGKGPKRAASGPTIDKIEKYEDTLEEGGVDDCECCWKRRSAIQDPSQDMICVLGELGN